MNERSGAARTRKKELKTAPTAAGSRPSKSDTAAKRHAELTRRDDSKKPELEASRPQARVSLSRRGGSARRGALPPCHFSKACSLPQLAQFSALFSWSSPRRTFHSL